MAEAQIKITADTSQAERALGALNNTLKGLATISSVVALAKFSDSLTNLQNKLNLVTQEGQSSNQLFLVMAKSAMNLGAPLKDVGDLFFRVANNTKDLGLAQTDQVKITETLIKGFQLTGATMGETQGAIVQLGQAFSTGTLRGDELNSVLEALPMVADAIAQKFGVQRGALKALGEQGKITSKDLSDAILASGASIDQAWGQRIPTVQESFNRLSTAMGVAFQQGGIGEGISNTLSIALLKIGNALISVIKFFNDWGGVIMGVIEVLTFFIIPMKVVRTVVAALMELSVPMAAAWAGLANIWRGAGAVLENLKFSFIWLVDLFAAAHVPMTAFQAAITKIGMGLSFLASVLGLKAVWDIFNGLFGKDKAEQVSTVTSELDKMNKSLGLDAVEASNKARAATAGATAEQLKNAESIRKATVSRNEELRKLTQGYEDQNKLTAFQGDQLNIETTILSTNRSLVKEILDSNGKRLGFTQGLNAAEESNLRTLLAQTEALKQQQALKAMTAPESTGQVTSRAGSIFGGTQGGLEVEATRQQEALKVLRQNGMVNEREYADQSIIIEKNKTDALIALDEKLMSARLKTAGVANDAITKSVTDQMANMRMAAQGGVSGMQGVLGIMDNVASSMGTYNKQAFESHKKMATVMAIISTYQSIVTTMATVPFPFNVPLAAAAGAAGFAQVAAIQSQTYSGRALGGPVQSGTSYIVGERGPEMFTPSSSGNITRNDQLGGSNVTVNFTIQANDTAGFDGLLNSRKGMIKQLITDAMLEKGQRF